MNDTYPPLPQVSNWVRVNLEDLPEVESLYNLSGQTNADTVVVFAQGGPANSLKTSMYCEQQPHLMKNFAFAMVHQAQSFNDKILEDSQIQATGCDALNAQSAGMFYKVANHLRNCGKRVIAMSHSFGSFILQQALVNYDNFVHRIIITHGRLDIPEWQWLGLKQGFGAGYDFNTGEKSVGTVQAPSEFQARFKLMGSAMEPRYTNLLKDIRLDNLAYIYSPNDPALSGLEVREVNFLKSKDAKIIVAPEKNHTAAITDSEMQNKILTEIRTGNI